MPQANVRVTTTKASAADVNSEILGPTSTPRITACLTALRVKFSTRHLAETLLQTLTPRITAYLTALRGWLSSGNPVAEILWRKSTARISTCLVAVRWLLSSLGNSARKSTARISSCPTALRARGMLSSSGNSTGGGSQHREFLLV